MTSGEYLKSIRNDRGLSLRGLSILSGVSHTQIADLENGVNFGTLEKINNILDSLKMTEKEKKEYYSLRDLERTPESIKKELEDLKMELINYKKNGIDPNIEIPMDFKKVPLYSSISAGYGACACDIIDMIALPNMPIFSGDVFAIRVNGDSMEDTIENNSIIFIKKDVEVPNKKIGAFIVNDEAYLKRYYCTDEGVFLRSDNRDYSDIRIKDTDNFVVVGKYIGSFVIDDK